MKVRLFSPTAKGLKSGSLKRVADALGKVLGYKVWRSTKQKPQRVHFKYGDAVNKLQQYKFFADHGLSALEYTTNWQEAKQWSLDGHWVFGRRLLNASCGDGIEVIAAKASNDDLDSAAGCPVYTKYKPKKREFRVHVFKDTVVAIVEKKQRKEWNGERNHKIRNLANGYVFAQACELTEALKARIDNLALAAGKVSGSDFKGVDLGYNEKHDDLFVIEVNSAPGIEGSNVEAYVKAMVKYAA